MGTCLELRGCGEGDGRDAGDGVGVADDEAVGHDALWSQAGVVRLAGMGGMKEGGQGSLWCIYEYNRFFPTPLSLSSPFLPISPN